jgi:hypothetical protein
MQQSELLPGVTVVARIHGMQGYSRAVTACFTPPTSSARSSGAHGNPVMEDVLVS